MIGDPDLSVGSPNDINADWHMFECEECGEVEEIDLLFNPSLTEFHCTGCGSVMVRIDE